MPTRSYRELQRVCAALGLKPVRGRTGTKWTGISPLNRRPLFLVVHAHAADRDIPDRLFRQYVSQLGFESVEQFRRFLKDRT